MEHLNYTYRSGTHVFADASLEAYPHEIVALVGPSGEGKTTMLRLILSLLYAQSGDLSISVPVQNQKTGSYVTFDQKAFFLCSAGKYHVFGNHRRKYAKRKAGYHR